MRLEKASGFFLFEETALRLQDTPCIWSRESNYSWRQAYTRACQYGNYFKGLQVQSSEYVAVYMKNSPELLLIWMGLLSIGAAPALINCNLASDGLLHCIRLSGCRYLVHTSDKDCNERIFHVEQRLKQDGVASIELRGSFVAKLDQQARQRPQVNCFQESITLPLALMYTRSVGNFTLIFQ